MIKDNMVIDHEKTNAFLKALPLNIKVLEILKCKENSGEVNVLFKTGDNIEINRAYNVKIDEAKLEYVFVEVSPTRTPMSFLRASEMSCRKALTNSDLDVKTRRRIGRELKNVLAAISKQKEINAANSNKSKNNMVRFDKMIARLRENSEAFILFDGETYKFEGLSEEVDVPKSRKRHYIYISNDHGEIFKIHLRQAEKIKFKQNT